MIETGSKNASVDTLWRITGALDMRLSELIRLVEAGHEHQARPPGRPCWVGQPLQKLFSRPPKNVAVLTRLP